MSMIARIGRRVPTVGFALYCGDKLVAGATTVEGLDESLAATQQAELEPGTYVPGLHVAGMNTETAAWFAAWRSTSEKRDIAIRDHQKGRTILVLGAFISAWNDGVWCDLVVDTVVIDARPSA